MIHLIAHTCNTCKIQYMQVKLVIYCTNEYWSTVRVLYSVRVVCYVLVQYSTVLRTVFRSQCMVFVSIVQVLYLYKYSTS
jgi:hypothetical protein